MIVTVLNFLTEQEVESIQNFLNKSFSGKKGVDRTIQRFGELKSYGSNKISDEIPEPLRYLIYKLEDGGWVQDIKHVTVNRYDAGQSIPFHIDNHEAGDTITIISLLSDATMLFKNDKGRVTSTPVPANSLFQFSGEHRTKMKHSIEPVESTRYSIVFRKD